MTAGHGRWDPPADVAALGAAQRVAFGLACAEHLYPTFALQVRAHPASLPPQALSPAAYRRCVDLMWAWLASAEPAMPACISEQQVSATETMDKLTPLAILVEDAHVTLWYARGAYAKPQDCINGGQSALEAVGDVVETLLGPRPDPAVSAEIDEELRICHERREAVATHELAELERAAQAETVEALTSDADPVELREPAQAVGARLAEWAAQVL